jgi:hypothetical protein
LKDCIISACLALSGMGTSILCRSFSFIPGIVVPDAWRAIHERVFDVNRK